MDTRVTIDTAALLEEVGWVQALARRLVRDAGEAEDVAQEAVLAALRGARAEPSALRQWLGAVVRNLGRNARRRGGRRARVEGPLETEPELPSTLELLERAATQRALVGALMELAEPYRSVLLLRYFQGLSNEDIARRTGVPASTVATRLARAHERLRSKWLAQNGGDRSTALAALAAFAEGLGEVAPAPAASPSAAAGRALPRAAFGAFSAAGLVALLLGAGWFLRDTSHLRVAGAPETPRAGAVLLADPAPARSSSSTMSMDAPAGALAAFLERGREALPATPSSPVCLLQPESIQGRVLDLDGLPVAGLVVCRVSPFVTSTYEPWVRRGAPTNECATSGEDGRFVLEARRLGWFTATTPGWTTVLGGELCAGDDETLLVVAPARAVGGVVTAADGRALAGVEVILEVPPQRLFALGTLLDVVQPIPRSATTDEQGAFAFDGAPRGDLLVTALEDGFEPWSAELEDHEVNEALRIELQPSTLPSVSGRVVDTAGAPVAGASVSLGQCIATSDATGAFRVSFDPAHRHGEPAAGSVLRAAREGVGHAQQEITLPGEGEPPLGVLLVLDGPARALEGRVLDPRGEPVPGVEVFVLEDTPFGRAPFEGAPQAWGERSLEEVLGARIVHTSADGRFRIEGLTAQSYRVQALDRSRLIHATSAPIPAGTSSIELVLDRDSGGPLAGRVVDRAGQPVPEVRVYVSLREWWSGPGDRTSALAIGEGADTDADGRFALEGVASEGIFLRLEGESIVPELFRDVDSEPERTALELVVARRCTLQLHWGDWNARADHLHLESEDGSRLEFLDLRGLSVTPMDSMSVQTGLSPALAIPDHAAHAVLTHDGAEVTRVRLHPVPGELERVNL